MLQPIIVPSAILFIFSVFIQNALIQWLKRRKTYQQIYELTPQSHQKKGQTVSFGGLGIIATIIIGLIIFQLFSIKVTWLLLTVLGFAALGFVDDYWSLKRKNNKGLSAKQKFNMQVLIALASLWAFHTFITPLNPAQWMLYTLAMVGCSNATNLTDGVDGLLAGLSLISCFGFAYMFFKADQWNMTMVCIVCIVALFGFWAFNRHPAQIFMGDTGSLALGALFTCFAMLNQNIWLLLPLGAVYILETLSVMIQVAVYKRTGKRVFKMTPLHHHFECLGWSEWKVVGLFYAMGAGFALLIIK